MIRSILKPEYLFRPKQLFKRLFEPKQDGFVTVCLPWGRDLRVSSNDNIGRQIVALGLYDLALTETLWRLCESGETALDVGANIGYTVYVMAERVKNGIVHAFEPHPTIFRELSDNIDSIRHQGCRTQIHVYQCAIGTSTGQLPLHVPKDFEAHRGESSLALPNHLPYADNTFLVEVDTLYTKLPKLKDVGVLKIDVEGFELEVLRGGQSLFERREIRDCVFEEHGTYPTPVTDWFLEQGYTLFRIDRSFWKPILLDPVSSSYRTNWTASNYLATIDPARAKKLFEIRGWGCLGGKQQVVG